MPSHKGSTAQRILALLWVNWLKSRLLELCPYSFISIIKWKLMFPDGASTMTMMGCTDNGRHIQWCTEILRMYSANPTQGHSLPNDQLQLIWRPAIICNTWAESTDIPAIVWIKVTYSRGQMLDSDFDLMIACHMVRSMPGYFLIMDNMSPDYETTMMITQKINTIMVSNIDL